MRRGWPGRLPGNDRVGQAACPVRDGFWPGRLPGTRRGLARAPWLALSSRRCHPRRPHRPGALVVDRLDRADHQLDAEAVVDHVVAGAADACRPAGGSSAAGRSRAASASASWGGTSSPVTPSSIISGMPPTLEATTGRDSAIASRIDQALRLAVGRQHRHVERRRHRRDVVAPAGEDHPVGDPQLARLGLEGLAPAPLADDQQVGVRDGPAAPPATPPAASGGPSRAPAARPRRRSATPGSIPYSSGSVQHASWWS